MNGNFRIGVLALIGLVVLAGAISMVFYHDGSSQILGLCTMVCVSLLALLHQGVASKLDDVAKETTEQSRVIEQVKKQTDGITEQLVRKSEKIAFTAGKEAGVASEVAKHDNGGEGKRPSPEEGVFPRPGA